MFWTNALQGFGFGLAFTPMTVLAFATLPARPDNRGLRRLHPGAEFRLEPLHLAVDRAPGALDRRQLRAHGRVHQSLQFGAERPGAPAAWNIGTTSGLIRLTNEIQRQASMIGYINAFYLIALTAAVAAPLVCLMRNRPAEP